MTLDDCARQALYAINALRAARGEDPLTVDTVITEHVEDLIIDLLHLAKVADVADVGELARDAYMNAPRRAVIPAAPACTARDSVPRLPR